MAYENTQVPVARSQEMIREMLYRHQGTGVMMVSHPPQEGLEALITIAELHYRVRIMATAKPTKRPDDQRREERRIWRVLYWHLKAMFEAADSGVIDIRDVILPYIVTRDGRTISEHIVPEMMKLAGTPGKLLVAGKVEI